MCVYVLVTQLCLTLCDSVDCSPPGSSVHGILQARIVEWVAIAVSRGIFPTQGLNPGLLHYRRMLYRLSYWRSPKKLIILSNCLAVQCLGLSAFTARAWVQSLVREVRSQKLCSATKNTNKKSDNSNCQQEDEKMTALIHTGQEQKLTESTWRKISYLLPKPLDTLDYSPSRLNPRRSCPGKHIQE